MNLQPLHDQVIVRRREAEKTTSSGIIIPDSAKEKPQEGEVIAVGTGIKKAGEATIPLEVKKGDKVLFGKYAGTEITLEGQEYILIKEQEILAIIL